MITKQTVLSMIQDGADGRPESFEAFRQRLESSRENSIDAFLQHHREFMGQGKRAIAWILLNVERANIQLQAGKAEHDWYCQPPMSLDPG
jgi:hypothetical protein